MNLLRPLLKKKQPGYILVFTLTILGILFILTTAVLNLVRFDQHLANQSYRVKQARQIAEAGIDLAIRRLNDDSTYSGETDLGLGDGTLTIAVTGTGSSRTIEAYGYIPNATNPTSKRKITVEASVNTTDTEFFYGIQVDGGGLQMGNTSSVTGNVYSNGDITGSNGAFITGDAIVAGGINNSPSQEYQNLNDDYLFATINDNRDLAQSFIATGGSGPLNRVAVLLAKVGAPTTNINVRITDNEPGDTPKPSAIASGTISAGFVGTTPSWIDISFATPPTLVNGTKYWIILDNSGSSAVDYWNWRYDDTNSHANNVGLYTSNWNAGGASWSSINGDLGYKVWIGGTNTKIDGLIIGDATTGTGRANAFINTTIHGSACPNQYCIIDNPPNEALPFSDGLLQDWRDDAAAGGTIIGDYNLDNSETASLGPKKIQGNLFIDNLSTLTITGTIYVTGNVTLSNNCKVKLDPGYGSGSGIFITDGNVLIDNNCAFTGAGQDSYILLVTAKDDKDNISVTIANNSVGVIYYAGKTRMKFSNNATAKEATAWGIVLDNGAAISYETGLANVLFSGGPGGGWTVKRSTWREIRIF